MPISLCCFNKAHELYDCDLSPIAKRKYEESRSQDNEAMVSHTLRIVDSLNPLLIFYMVPTGHFFAKMKYLILTSKNHKEGNEEEGEVHCCTECIFGYAGRI